MNIFCLISLDMIAISEIYSGDLIKILVNVEDVEDEMYAVVQENCEDYLIVKYYSETSLIYKDAQVYTLDDDLVIGLSSEWCRRRLYPIQSRTWII